MHPSRISLSSAFLLALLAATPTAHAASVCPAGNLLSTPTTDFTVNGNGTVTHLKTGLMWKQCAEGLSGASCATGTATAMTWSAALSAAATPYAGYSDWRLPNQKELASIVETGCYGPSINETVFPLTPLSYFWSSTARTSFPGQAWDVFFDGGYSTAAVKSTNYYVRLVRGGQSFDFFDAQKANQTISFGAAPTVVAGGTGTVSASGGASLNPVTFSSATPGVCTVVGSTVTGVSVGTCTIAAAQAGNATYNAAPQVAQSFTVAAAPTTYTGATATNSGTATATVVSGGGAGCGFTGTPQFVPPSSPPAGVTFPHGLFNFTLGGCTAGSTVTLSIAYPSAVPAGTQYWKYGRTPASPTTPIWYAITPTSISGNTVTFTVTDGGSGDDDRLANGTIVDPGGIGVQGAATAVPTLSEWGMILLAGLLGLFGVGVMRRRSRVV